MGTQAMMKNIGPPRLGRPRVSVDLVLVRRLRDGGWTLNEIAAETRCGRGTVARALEKTAATAQGSPGADAPLTARAAELARSRFQPPRADAMRRERLRENARHLAHRRWGDGMKVEGQPFAPRETSPPSGDGSRWTGLVLMIGGLLLWAAGCPVPL